jgi:hypothetical protein
MIRPTCAIWLVLVGAVSACATTDPDVRSDAQPDAAVVDDATPSDVLSPDDARGDVTPPPDVSIRPDVTPDMSMRPDVTPDTSMRPDVTGPPDVTLTDRGWDLNARCGDSAQTLCFQKTPEGFCNDIVFVPAYCMSEQWACPPGYLISWDCPCGAPLPCPPDSGGDRFIVDNITPICGDGSGIYPLCLRQRADGTCDESAGSVKAICTGDHYVCPSGSVSYDECLCGVPPTIGCRDGSADADQGD